MSCLFCAIAAGDVPAKLLHADERAVAFLDISPWQRGHTLVIPRRHVADLTEDTSVLADLTAALDEVTHLLTDRLGAVGFNLLSNAGPVSGQEVMHLHLHVIPRYADDSRPGVLGMKGEAHDDLDEVHGVLTS